MAQDEKAVRKKQTEQVSATSTTPILTNKPPVQETASTQPAKNTFADEYMSGNSVVSVKKEECVSKLSWHNLEYSIPLPKQKGHVKTLLSNVHGEVLAGEVIGIMGGSGAGKSTLLNLLAGRIGPAGKVSGEILVDGVPRRHAIWRNQCAYVEQDDLLFPNLSVYETIKYAALLRLPRTMPDEIKLKRVDEVIMELGLHGCRDSWIGGPSERGISGGERKRVSIAIELVSQPTILFLDEPTTGLDAFTAVNIIDTIKRLAISQKKIVLMTIHQPRTDILEMFDKISLLSVGKVTYFGPLSDALVYFSNLGFPLPPKTNPSDFFIDVVTLDQRSEELKEKSLTRIKLFQDAWDAVVANGSEGKAMAVAASAPKEAKKTQWPSPWSYELWVLLARDLVNMRRDKSRIGPSFGQAVFLLIILGFAYFKSGLDQAGVQNRIGICFFLAVNLMFGNLFPIILSFPLQKAIVKHERSAGTYRPSSAFVAKVLSNMPLVWLPMLVLTVPIYWMIGLQDSASKFFIYLLILFVHVNCASALGIAIGSAVPNVTMGQIISPVIGVLFILYGGQLANLDTITWALRWIQYLSIVAYTNKALTQNEFNTLTFTCNGETKCLTSGPVILSTFALDSIPMWNCIGLNVAIFVGFLIIGFLFFKKTSKPLLRLF